jgi:hypothetical protein
MAHEDVARMRLMPRDEGASALVQSRASLSEVQVCGIPKLSARGVAPT